MNSTTKAVTDKLADALRSLVHAVDLRYPGTDFKPGHWREPYDAAHSALAAYDAQQTAAWTTEDDSAAVAEGWVVSRTSDGFDEIQKLDDADIFTEDAQAIAHVYWMAGTGSDLHKRAIAHTLREGNTWTYTQASIAARAKRSERVTMCVNAHDGLVSALLKVANLQAFAMTDGRGMQGDNADELARIVSDALTQAGANL